MVARNARRHLARVADLWICIYTCEPDAWGHPHMGEGVTSRPRPLPDVEREKLLVA